MTVTEIAEICGGRVELTDEAAADAAGRRVDGPVAVDSREIEPGGLFVARVGEVQDGHTFTAAAAAAGAAAAVVERVQPDVALPQIVVADAEHALGRLARGVVDRLTGRSASDGTRPTVIGITGSSGKTTTKDLLAQVLAPAGPVVAPPGSYNTEVGVPLTVLRSDEDTRSLVVEMGARGVGHIAYLCAVVPPQIGVVLNVGTAHLGEFGGRDAIAQAKGELVEALPEDGVAVLNGDDPMVRRMAERTTARVITFGESVHAEVRAEDVELGRAGRAGFTLVTPEASARVELQLVGEHHVANALAAAAVSYALGRPLEETAAALTGARALSRWRREVTERPDGITVVNDAYNANPDSVRAALKSLVSMGRGRRTWAVLGEMLELGDASAAEHDAIGRLVVRLNIGRLIAVGEGTRALHQGASLEGSWDGESAWVPDRAAAQEILDRELAGDDVVLVKSSRDAGLRHLGDAIAGREAGEA